MLAHTDKRAVMSIFTANRYYTWRFLHSDGLHKMLS